MSAPEHSSTQPGRWALDIAKRRYRWLIAIAAAGTVIALASGIV